MANDTCKAIDTEILALGAEYNIPADVIHKRFVNAILPIEKMTEKI